MIEILNILFLLFSSSILLTNIYTINLIKKIITTKQPSLMTIFSINILILMLTMLFFSFFNINLVYFIIIIFLISLIGLTKKKNAKVFLSKNNLLYLIFFLIISFIFALDLVANPKLEWDGHGWYFHAFNFNENLNFFNLVNTDRYNQPHLGGIFWGVFWNLSFLDYEFYGRLFYIILYSCAILSVSESTSKILLNRVVISSVLIFLTYDKFLFGGYQEVLVFSIITLLCNIIFQINLRKLNITQIYFITIFSSLLLWSKNEGIIFFTIFVIYLTYFQNLKNKFVLISLSIFMILVKLYFVNLNEILEFTSKITSIYFFDINLIYEKFKFIFIHIIIAMFKYPIWILFIFLIILKKNFKKHYDVLYFSVISIFFIFIVYLLNDVDDYKWLVTGSLDRFIFQASGFLTLFISNSISSIFRRSNN